MLYLTKVSLWQTSQVQDGTSGEKLNLKNSKTLSTKRVFKEQKTLMQDADTQTEMQLLVLQIWTTE